MNDLMERSISLQEFIGYFDSPWKFVAAYAVYCLTIGTLQNRKISKHFHESHKRQSGYYYISNEDKFILFLSQIAAPIPSAIFLIKFICVSLGKSITWAYSMKEPANE